jgi:hypothetical protein
VQPLINDVILPAERSGMLDRIKNGLGMSGAAATFRKMGVAPRAAEFMESQTKIDEVTGFAHGLWLRHVRDDEMPTKVIDVSRVNYLVGQVLNGGFTTFSTREHNGKKVWAWNFIVGKTPGEGHHQAIFVDGEAIMFKGNTDTIVARMLAPECAPGSAVARNEPDKEPGMEHRNISFRIPNP